MQKRILGSSSQYDGSAGVDPGAVEPLGSIAIEPGAALNPLGAKPEPEEGENECRPLKKVKSEKVRGGQIWLPTASQNCPGLTT